MSETWFYHLEQSALEQVLPDLLEKTSAKGWRSLVKFGPYFSRYSDGAGALEFFDEHLWTYKTDGFLAHGHDQEPFADLQPILLSEGERSAEGFEVVILVGGAQISNTDRLERTIIVLDGNHEQDAAIARQKWRDLKQSTAVARYWKQDDYGRWHEPFKA